LSYLVAGAAKTQPNVNAVLETAKTKNTLYNLLFYRTKSDSCLNKGVVFKVKYSSIYSEDFVIICSVIAGRQAAEQSHAAKH
jgi:hypothetical protein